MQVSPYKIKIMKDKDRLRNWQKTKEKWQLHAVYEPKLVSWAIIGTSTKSALENIGLMLFPNFAGHIVIMWEIRTKVLKGNEESGQHSEMVQKHFGSSMYYFWNFAINCKYYQ